MGRGPELLDLRMDSGEQTILGDRGWVIMDKLFKCGAMGEFGILSTIKINLEKQSTFVFQEKNNNTNTKVWGPGLHC